MKLDREAVERLAKLAKIQLSEEEKQRMEKDLSAILEFIAMLNGARTEGIPETSQVTGLQNVIREDHVSSLVTRDELLVTMPAVDQEGYLKVHAVFRGESPSH